MVIHPAHAEDILQFLSFMLTWPGPDSYTVNAATAYDPRNLYLMGHSCAAHMLTSIFLNSSAVTPTLTPSPLLIESVRGIILSEGIYDIDLLISSFPSYREWFITDAFGDQTSYSDVATTKLPLWSSDTHMRWLVIHSEKDTLVDLRQSEAIWNHLNDVHTEAGLVPEEFVLREMEGLIWGHNEILRQPEFIGLVKGFISGNCTVRTSN
jgi:acetyl esterase/lipase